MLRAVLFIGLFLILCGPAWGGNHKPSLPPAETEDDQAYVIQVGYGTNEIDTRIFRAKYVQLLFHQVKIALFGEYADESNRADLLTVLQIYPFDAPLYFMLGGGASKGEGNSSTLVLKSGVGYEYNLSPLWYLDASGGRDWESGISGRWTLLLGLGKRF